MPVCDEKKYVFDDDKRPALPYVAGACFEIKRHEPLTPFDDHNRTYKYPEVSSLSDPVLPTEILRPDEILEPGDNLTPWIWVTSEDTDPCKFAPETITERYLRHRPRKTTPHHEDRTTRRLEIVRQIRARDGAYAQVVQCRVDGIQGPLVAKIFDPLYRWEDIDLEMAQSPVGLTESEWSREAAAYTKIEEMKKAGKFDSRYTPRFEGCWSFDIPYELELVSNSTASHASTTNTTTGGSPSGRSGGKQRRGSSEELVRETIKVTRNVRLLLMEYIPGDSILHLLKTGAYQDIPPEVRMELLAQVSEAESALWHIRVSQGDRHSRNVIVVCAKKEDHRSSSSHSGKGEEEEEARNEQEEREQREQSDKEWRVVWIDFGGSVVLDLPNATSNIKGRRRQVGKLPPNPITRCRGSWPIDGLYLAYGWWEDGTTQEEANWIDKRYDGFEERRKWMEERWGEGSPSAHLYQPVEYDKLHKPPPPSRGIR